MDQKLEHKTKLYLHIDEGKNLPVKDITGSSDPYCEVKIDNQVIARTSTVWKSLSPFWGEDYTVYLPNGFHQLSVYVYDEDKLNRDDFIGKLSLTRSEIKKPRRGIDGWHELKPAIKDEEIQGEIHLELSRHHYSDNSYLRIKVLEARELAPKDSSGASDPFVRIEFLNHITQTQKIKASRFPKWNEILEFIIPSFTSETTQITISVWDWDRVGGNDFMGQVVLSLGEVKEGKVFNQWFRLAHSETAGLRNHSLNKKPLGSVRLRARLIEERILPSEHYAPLIEILNDSVSLEKHKLMGPNPLKMLQDVATLNLIEMANTLVKLYLGQGNIVDYLDMICAEEINQTKNPNTLFRGNSLATKSVDQFMKIVGIPYLIETLGPILQMICEEQRLVELDPHRLELMRKARRPSLKHVQNDDDLIASSKEILQRYLAVIVDTILHSISKMPPVMRLVFQKIQGRIHDMWPEHEYHDHQYLGVSGFLFLRFLVPAILNPKLFFLQDGHPSSRNSRTLTLLAKCVQIIGSLGLQLGQGKEKFLEPLYPFIKKSVEEIRPYLDRLLNIDEHRVHIDATRRRSVFHPSVIVKQGGLQKQRWCEKRGFHAIGFRTRYFWLKYDSISYAKKATDNVRTTVPIHQIIAVEMTDKTAFGKENVGQIVFKNYHGELEVLFFASKDVNEAYSWISSLRKMVIVNSDSLDYFHPGAYRHSRWSCCLQPAKHAAGCSKAHTHAILGDWRDPLDPDVEAQIIFSQIHKGKHVLRDKYLKTSEVVKNSLWQQQEETLYETDIEQQTSPPPLRPPSQNEAPHSSRTDSGENDPHRTKTTKPLTQSEPSHIVQYQTEQTVVQNEMTSSSTSINTPLTPLDSRNQTEQSHQSITSKTDKDVISKDHTLTTNNNKAIAELPSHEEVMDHPPAVRKSHSVCDAEIASVAQLLDVVNDLEKAHIAFDLIEKERQLEALHNVLDNSPIQAVNQLVS